LQSQWAFAAEHFTSRLKIDQLDGADACTLDILECGPALIEAGESQEYERFRTNTIGRFADTALPFADRIIKISLLAPANEKVIAVLSPMAASSEKAFVPGLDAEADIFLAAWRSVSLALLEFRRGDYAKSVAWCRRCLAYPEYNAPRSATARVILAMSCWQLHQAGEARSELTQGRELIEAKFKNGLDRGTGVQGFWFDWVFARILLREADALIEKSPSHTIAP